MAKPLREFTWFISMNADHSNYIICHKRKTLSN